MYLRLDSVDPILQAFRVVQKSSDICTEKIESQERRLSAFEETALSEIQSMKEDFLSLKKLMIAQISSLQTTLQRFEAGSQDKIPRELAEAIAFRGDNANALYRAFSGTEKPLSSSPAPIPFTSTLCHQHHFLLDQYRFWIGAIKERPRFLRKRWEWFFIAQVLYERGFMSGGKRGIGFGVGNEPLPALLASFGVQIVASDQSVEAAEKAGWAQSNQHSIDLSTLNDKEICTGYMFSELVSFMEVDMNNIDFDLHERFDFCWSSCALEHLGSLQNGLKFIENSLRVLKPGGLAVHTTEFNISSNVDTLESGSLSIYRRCDIDNFLARIMAEGFTVSPVDWSLGEGFAETVVDLPPYGRGEPHIRLKVGEYNVTSIGIIIQKPS
jgi:SAM-dependent methyltransferase